MDIIEQETISHQCFAFALAVLVENAPDDSSLSSFSLSGYQTPPVSKVAVDILHRPTERNAYSCGIQLGTEIPCIAYNGNVLDDKYVYGLAYKIRGMVKWIIMLRPVVADQAYMIYS